MFYDICVCETCGYASLIDKFEDITDLEVSKLQKELLPRWDKHKFGTARAIDKDLDKFINNNQLLFENVFSPKWAKNTYKGERSIDSALSTFELAYYNLYIRKSSYSHLAKIAIRIAWIYRINKDIREKKVLEHTLTLYLKIFETEKLPAGNLDECMCLYMIGELYLRTGEFKNAITWFSKLIASPLGKLNPRLIEATRDQLQLAREQMKK
jgi:hypothetical protein